MKEKNQKITNQVRSFSFPTELVRNEDSDDRIIEAAIASETPVLRYFGYEILSMESKHLDLKFLRSGRAPLLWGHDQRSIPIGVVETVTLDKKEKLLRAKIRFSESAEADRIYSDVKSGIINNLSIGYVVREMEETEDKIEDVPVYRSLKTEIREISFVSLGADDEAYVGRSDEEVINNVNSNNNSIETKEENLAMADSKETKKDTAPDLTQVRAEASKAAEKRVTEILELGYRHNMKDEASAYIKDGRTVADFQRHILENLEVATKETEVQSGRADENVPVKEHKRYSLNRALNAKLTGDWSQAGFEREVSEEIAHRSGKQPEGIYIPEFALQQRILSAGTATEGAELVGTYHADELYISPIFAKSVLVNLGAKTLSGLVDDYEIPGSGGADFYWLATETTDITEDTPATFNRTLTPHTVGGLVKMTHKSLKQATPSTDAITRDMLVRGIGSVIDKAGIDGSGAAGQPEGILKTTGIGDIALSGAAPTWAMAVGLQKEVEIDNLEGVSYLTDPRVRYKLLTTPKVASTDSVMISEDRDRLAGYPLAVTNNVPTDLPNTGSPTAATYGALIFGDFSQLYMGQWGSVDVDVSNSDGTDFKSGKVAIRIMADVDFAVARPEGFAACQDIDYS